MGSSRQSATERRLAQLRVLKEQHFADELTPDEIIEAKNARIELLEDEVAKLRKRVNTLEARARRTTEPDPKPPRPKPENEIAEPRFDFYRS